MKRTSIGLCIVLMSVMATVHPLFARSMATIHFSGGREATLVAGKRFSATIPALPRPSASTHYCLGLTSTIDRSSLPIDLGVVRRDAQGVGHVVSVVPPQLLAAEPKGPFLLFVGTCTPIAPDRPIVAQANVIVIPS